MALGRLRGTVDRGSAVCAEGTAVWLVAAGDRQCRGRVPRYERSGRPWEGRIVAIHHMSTESAAASACADGGLTALRALAGRRVEDGLPALVEELGNLGFSWRDVARTAGVSPAVLRRWRQGAPDVGGDLNRVAMLVALCEVAYRDHQVGDVAGRPESPISPAAPVTGMDLVVSDRWDLVLRLLASGADGAEAVLAEFEPRWRERYGSEVEVFVAPDGLPGVRLN